MGKSSRHTKPTAQPTAQPTGTSDFDVAYAVARDILEWPPEQLRKIALADEETQCAFVEWIKTRLATAVRLASTLTNA